MKGPFRLQATNYDCVPTCFVNALTFLYAREDVPAEVIQKIYLCSLDDISVGGLSFRGTTEHAITMLGYWLGAYSQASGNKRFSPTTDWLVGEDVHFGFRSKLAKCVKSGGVALLRVTHGKTWHFIAVIGVDGETVQAFDPYPVNSSAGYEFNKSSISRSHNVTIRKSWLAGIQRPNDKLRLGQVKERRCLLIAQEDNR